MAWFPGVSSKITTAEPCAIITRMSDPPIDVLAVAEKLAELADALAGAAALALSLSIAADLSRGKLLPPVLSVGEAAAELGVSRATGYRWADAGLLVLLPLPGRKRVLATSVIALRDGAGVSQCLTLN